VKSGVRCYACPGCGSLSRPDRRDLERRYADYLPPATLSLPPGTRARYREMLEALDPWRDGEGRLLDVGAGAGLFLDVARETGWKVEGTELSLAASRAAAERGIRVHVGDLARLPLDPGSFDAVVTLETVEHVPSPPAFLAAVFRLVRPGGGLLLTTPNYDSLSRRLLGREWLAVSPDHLCLFTPRALRRCVTAAGFRVVDLTTRTILPNEVLKRFRRTPARVSGFRAEETATLQEAFVTRPAMKRLKDLVNRVLGKTGTGDVITLLAEREVSP
jgi:2-polyprenyl-3-methyl-5-hydroxy-6-metoxy-1,4-benzoquinol methylase